MAGLPPAAFRKVLAGQAIEAGVLWLASRPRGSHGDRTPRSFQPRNATVGIVHMSLCLSGEVGGAAGSWGEP